MQRLYLRMKDDDSMDVVGHDYELIQLCREVMVGNVKPISMCN